LNPLTPYFALVCSKIQLPPINLRAYKGNLQHFAKIDFLSFQYHRNNLLEKLNIRKMAWVGNTAPNDVAMAQLRNHLITIMKIALVEE
jgi:hypothetical protein